MDKNIYNLVSSNEKLRLINTMAIIDYSASGEDMEYILADDNERNRNILYKIGLTDFGIEEECTPNNGIIDLINVGFKLASCWCNSQGFYNE